ncbi:MAG: hypothetical protein ACHQ2Z_11175 [Elusimicrobiota bacterium]
MAELAALGAAAALAAMLFASRLPPGPEFLLPRRGGYALYRAAWDLFGAHGGRESFSALIALVLLACAAALALSLKRAMPKHLPATWTGRAGLLPGPVFAAFLAARLVSHVLDSVQLVWFPYGSMNLREPLATFALGAIVFAAAAAAARAWVAGRRRRASTVLAALVALDVATSLFGAAKGVGRALDLPAARGKTLYVVLTEGPRGPDRDVYALSPDVFVDPDPRAALHAIASGPRDARMLPALRALYEEAEKRWDLPGLRDALLLGASRGDLLAASLLLSHLAAVPRSPEALAALGSLSNENYWRIGPLAAAEISRAYAHLGNADEARRWAEKSDGPRGIAPGLLLPAGAETRLSGRISGTLNAPYRARVALYVKADAEAPYLLDAAGLVAAAEPDAKGRFTFNGLPAGRYYLAIAQSAGEGAAPEISVSGSRGDIVLGAERPAINLPLLTLKLGPR